eukprot:scaffold1435_cov267-Pinguiococcus_pyrenoidosus.AAC.10
MYITLFLGLATFWSLLCGRDCSLLPHPRFPFCFCQSYASFRFLRAAEEAVRPPRLAVLARPCGRQPAAHCAEVKRCGVEVLKGTSWACGFDSDPLPALEATTPQELDAPIRSREKRSHVRTSADRRCDAGPLAPLAALAAAHRPGLCPCACQWVADLRKERAVWRSSLRRGERPSS